MYLVTNFLLLGGSFSQLLLLGFDDGVALLLGNHHLKAVEVAGGSAGSASGTNR